MDEVYTAGMFGKLSNNDKGIQLLIQKFRNEFKRPENINFYSENDYKDPTVREIARLVGVEAVQEIIKKICTTLTEKVKAVYFLNKQISP